jgi:D-alanyl-D-alanine carboxypeptidase/D-alanyl-D-alanine-endopeptidase (penicillin-binding protein 4)
VGYGSSPRRILAICLAVVPLLGGPARAQNLGERIEAVMRSSPATERASWGVEVFDPAVNEILFASSGDRLFLPASNVKLFTTALALTRLGPDYRFVTQVRASAAPDASGRIAGDLILVGGGDPLLSARQTPYKKGPVTGNPLQAIEELADQVAARGVRRIDGDILGDDTRYTWEPHPEGWTGDDTTWDFAAPVSALVVNDGAIALTLRAKQPGQPPEIALAPPLEWFSIDNRVRTGAGLETKVSLERLAGSRQVRLWGTQASGSETKLSLAVDDPAAYAAQALDDALERRGIAIRGRALARHCYANQQDCQALPAAPGIELARRESPPLLEALRTIDKASLNVHSEAVLREVGRSANRAAGGLRYGYLRPTGCTPDSQETFTHCQLNSAAGTSEAGLREMRTFLTGIGIEPGAYNLADASGLSRYNLVTPDALVKLLAYMYRSPYREQCISLLPQGGEDGTLENRFSGSPAAHRIRAKTGSIEHSMALSGYADSRTRGTLVFSILVNDFIAPAVEKRALIDKIALIIAGE